MHQSFFTNLTLASIVTILAGCATTSDTSTPLQLSITVANDANPDEAGRPSPIVLDIFDLARTERFRDADYLALLSAPQKKLRSDMLDRHRLAAVAPGSQRVLTLAVDPKATYIGVVAELVQFADVKTRLALPLDPGHATTLKLIVNADGIVKSNEAPPRVSLHNRFNDD